jgi:hypothetical protein
MLRFTIRDVLWLTLVVAMGAGWWVDRGRLADRCEMLSRQVWEAFARDGGMPD